MLESILVSLIGIAASVGAYHVVDQINRGRVSSKRVTNSDIYSAVEGILQKASNFKSGELTKLTNQLYSIPNITSVSPAVNDALARMKKKNLDKQSNVEKAVTDISNKANDLRTKAQNFMYSTDSYKLSAAGQQDASDIKTAANKLQGDLNNYEKTIK